MGGSSIADFVRYEDVTKVFRSYQPKNGVWKSIGIEETRGIVIDRVGALLRPMLHLQCFRAHHDEVFRSSMNVVTPQRVNKVMNMYGQSIQHIKYVLDTLIMSIKTPFVSNPFKNVIVFENGMVDLKTGVLKGPAEPGMLITHCVPHEYKPDVDTTKVAELMQSFFPERCYPGESAKMLDFYRRWCGYNITGEIGLQKALFVVGRGANGKSVLAAISRDVWGAELCKAVDSCHFQEGVGANNDNVFQVPNSFQKDGH